MLSLYVAPYSQAKTRAQLLLMLSEAPEQEPNSSQAFAGYVFEVVATPGGSSGTLSEVRQHCPSPDGRYLIVCPNGDQIEVVDEGTTFKALAAP